MSDKDDDDYIDLDEQIDFVVEKSFTPLGPQYDQDFKEIASKHLKMRLSGHDESIKHVSTLAMTTMMVNALMIDLLDEMGVEVVTAILDGMADQYSQYLKESSQDLH